MKIKGTEISKRDVYVEVNPREILDIIQRKIKRIYKDYDRNSYIEEGILYEFKYTNQHNGDDEYISKPATANDIKWHDFMNILEMLLNEEL